MGNLPRGRTCLGVKTPDGRNANPPPWVGARYGDWSRYQQRNIHWGWDVWEVNNANIVSPRRGTVIATKNRAQAFPDYNVVVMLALRVPSRLKPGKIVTVYAQYLHTHPKCRVGQKLEANEKIGEINFAGMEVMGNPHAHIEFFWSKTACLTYNHPAAVDPYFIRRHYFKNEDSPLVLVPRRYAWWPDRKFFPGTSRRIKPYEREPIRSGNLMVESFGSDPAEADVGDEALVDVPHNRIANPKHSCGTGDTNPEHVAASLRENGLEPVYLDNGELDIETMMFEQEGLTLEAVRYGQDADEAEENTDPEASLPSEDE